MIRVLMGLQTQKGIEATEFSLLKTVDVSLDNTINEIVSNAITGKDFATEGLVNVGTITGTITTEVSRKDLGILFKAEGFNYSVVATDTVFLAPEIATYPFLTIVMEFTDDGGTTIYKKFLDVKINDLTLNLNTNSYVQVQMTPISEIAGSITDGKFVGTLIQDTEKSLIVKETKISIGGTNIECGLTSLAVDINNNLSSIDVLCGTVKVNKSGNRSITINESMPVLMAVEYKAELEKAELGTPQAVLITLSNTDKENMVLSIPKCTYSAISMGNLSGSGSSDRTLNARWDDSQTTPTAMIVTAVGLIIGSRYTVNKPTATVSGMTISIADIGVTDANNVYTQSDVEVELVDSTGASLQPKVFKVSPKTTATLDLTAPKTGNYKVKVTAGPESNVSNNITVI